MWWKTKSHKNLAKKSKKGKRENKTKKFFLEKGGGKRFKNYFGVSPSCLGGCDMSYDEGVDIGEGEQES